MCGDRRAQCGYMADTMRVMPSEGMVHEKCMINTNCKTKGLWLTGSVQDTISGSLHEWPKKTLRHLAAQVMGPAA
jgi:hypothetical protein